jgi:hypothetical protein
MTKQPSAESLDSPDEIFLDRLLGREVFTANGRRVGRVEEFRADESGGDYVVTDYVIGAAGLFERLGVGVKVLIGLRTGGYLATWDQVDITNPDRPRLTCPGEAMRSL